jgi:hypothetical protein
MNEQEFWEAFKPVEIKSILYRLYYDEQGAPLFFSQEDLPGNYIDITREVYVNPPKHFKVIDGKIELIETSIVRRLYPDENGTPCHPDDISIVVQDSENNIKWSMK